MRDRGEERERARARDCVCEREREKEIGEKGERESLFPLFLTHLFPPPHTHTFWQQFLDQLPGLPGLQFDYTVPPSYFSDGILDMRVKPATTEELHAVFNTFDTDGGGDVSVVELERMLQRLGVATTPDSVAAMLTKYDVDGNGVLDFEEFTSFVLLCGIFTKIARLKRRREAPRR